MNVEFHDGVKQFARTVSAGLVNTTRRCLMARSKRGSPALEKAATRLSSIRGINTTLDLGNGFSVSEYDTRIKAAKDLLDEYNANLSAFDGALNGLEAAETDLNDYSDRILAAVGVKFGRD